MAETKITQLPPGTGLNGTELLEAVQVDQSVRISTAQIATYVNDTVFGSLIPVPAGGTGAASLTGYVFGTGVAPLSSTPTIPYTDIAGLGTGATINIAVSATAPVSPAIGDLWVDIS